MFSKYLDPKNDVAFKKVFGSEKHKDILIHFINDILNFTGSQAIQKVTFLNPALDPEIASKKQSLVDVLCTDENGVQYIIEMQVAQTTGFEKRAQYYAAKAYCRQLSKGRGEEGKYSNLKEIIFIAIADCILFPEKLEYKSDHILLDKNTGDHDLKDFYFTFIELPKFRKNLGDPLDNIVEKWCYFFKYAEETSLEDLNRIIENDVVIKMAYEALEQYSWTPQEFQAYEREVKRVMDNAAVEEFKINSARAEGKTEGRAEGRAEGREEGIKEGIEKGREEGIKKQAIEMAKLMLSADRPVSEIIKFTGLSKSEILALNK